MLKYKVRVAGVTAENRQEILKSLPQNTELDFYLQKEPENSYDKNAVAVYYTSDNQKVGYVPRNSSLYDMLKNAIEFDVTGRILGGGPNYNYGIVLTCTPKNYNEDFEIKSI